MNVQSVVQTLKCFVFKPQMTQIAQMKTASGLQSLSASSAPSAVDILISFSLEPP
jgi:hypothetical protein